MKLNFSIDLENNEVFEKEIQKALRAEAKRIAREQFVAVMEEEVKRVAAARAEEFCKGRLYDGTIREIRADVNSAIADYLRRKEFSPAYIQNKMDDLLKKAQTDIDERIDGIDHKVEERTDKIVRECFDKAFADKFVRQIMRRSCGDPNE